MGQRHLPNNKNYSIHIINKAYKWLNFLSNKFFSCTLTFCNNNWNVFKELHIGLVFRTRLKTGVLFVRNTKCRITLNRIRKITLLKIQNSIYIDEERDLFSDYILVVDASEVDQVSNQIPKMLNANKRIQERRSCWQQCPRNKSKFMSFLCLQIKHDNFYLNINVRISVFEISLGQYFRVTLVKQVRYLLKCK